MKRKTQMVTVANRDKVSHKNILRATVLRILCKYDKKFGKAREARTAVNQIRNDKESMSDHAAPQRSGK